MLFRVEPPQSFNLFFSVTKLVPYPDRDSRILPPLKLVCLVPTQDSQMRGLQMLGLVGGSQGHHGEQHQAGEAVPL